MAVRALDASSEVKCAPDNHRSEDGGSSLWPVFGESNPDAPQHPSRASQLGVDLYRKKPEDEEDAEDEEKAAPISIMEVAASELSSEPEYLLDDLRSDDGGSSEWSIVLGDPVPDAIKSPLWDPPPEVDDRFEELMGPEEEDGREEGAEEGEATPIRIRHEQKGPLHLSWSQRNADRRPVDPLQRRRRQAGPRWLTALPVDVAFEDPEEEERNVAARSGVAGDTTVRKRPTRSVKPEKQLGRQQHRQTRRPTHPEGTSKAVEPVTQVADIVVLIPDEAIICPVLQLQCGHTDLLGQPPVLRGAASDQRGNLNNHAEDHTAQTRAQAHRSATMSPNTKAKTRAYRLADRSLDIERRQRRAFKYAA